MQLIASRMPRRAWCLGLMLLSLVLPWQLRAWRDAAEQREAWRRSDATQAAVARMLEAERARKAKRRRGEGHARAPARARDAATEMGPMPLSQSTRSWLDNRQSCRDAHAHPGERQRCQCALDYVRIEYPLPASAAGECRADAISRVLRRHADDVAACYEQRALDNDDTTRAWDDLRFQIMPDGSTVALARPASAGAGARLDACVSAAAARWTFPTTCVGEVDYPLLIEPQRVWTR